MTDRDDLSRRRSPRAGPRLVAGAPRGHTRAIGSPSPPLPRRRRREPRSHTDGDPDTSSIAGPPRQALFEVSLSKVSRHPRGGARRASCAEPLSMNANDDSLLLVRQRASMDWRLVRSDTTSSDYSPVILSHISLRNASASPLATRELRGPDARVATVTHRHPAVTLIAMVDDSHLVLPIDGAASTIRWPNSQGSRNGPISAAAEALPSHASAAARSMRYSTEIRSLTASGGRGARKSSRPENGSSPTSASALATVRFSRSREVHRHSHVAQGSPCLYHRTRRVDRFKRI